MSETWTLWTNDGPWHTTEDIELVKRIVLDARLQGRRDVYASCSDGIKIIDSVDDESSSN